MTRVYLSRLVLDPAHPEVDRLMELPARLQDFIAASVPHPAAETGTRVLYYIEEDEHSATLHVQSPSTPVFEHLPVAAITSARTEDITPVLEKMTKGDPFVFTLAAAPRTRERGPKPGRSNGREVPKAPAERLPWLARQLEPAADVLSSLVESVTDIRVHDYPPIIHRQVLFTGSLEVTDPARLAALVREGIGPGKAYGNGLLRLTPTDV